MLSTLVKSKRAATARFLGLSLVCALSTHAPVSLAEWTDPLDTPAISTQLAHRAPLLGIANADDRIVAVGAYGNIIYSTDSGTTWSQGSSPVSVTLTAVEFANAQIGWAVGHDGVILKTEDGGESWKKQFDGYRANQLMIVGAEKRFKQAEEVLSIAQESGDDDRIYEAEIAFESADFGLQDAQYDAETGSTKPFLSIWVENENRAIAIGAYGMFFETLDGGKNWVDISSRLPNPDRLHLNNISLLGGTSLAVIGEMGFIARSDDNGMTWMKDESPYEGSLFGVINDNDTQILFSLRGHVYRSDSNSQEWTELDTGSEQTLLDGVIGKNKSVLVGNGGSVVVLDNTLSKAKSKIIEGRKGSAAVVESSKGYFIVAGESGIKVLDPNGDAIELDITMLSEAQ